MEQESFEELAKEWMAKDENNRTIQIQLRSHVSPPFKITLIISPTATRLSNCEIEASAYGSNLVDAFNEAYNALKAMVE